MGCISLWPWEFSGSTGGYTPLGAALWDRIGNDSGEEGMSVKTKPLRWQQAEWGLDVQLPTGSLPSLLSDTVRTRSAVALPIVSRPLGLVQTPVLDAPQTPWDKLSMRCPWSFFHKNGHEGKAHPFSLEGHGESAQHPLPTPCPLASAPSVPFFPQDG